MTPSQKEELRHAVLEVLATREGVALSIDAIRRRVERPQLIDFPVTNEDAGAALMFLAGLTPPLVKITQDDFGATKYAQATSAGVLAHERGTLA